MERKRSLLLLKLESEYGTDPTPAAASDAILTLDEPSVEMVTQSRERNAPLNYFGQLAPLVVGEAVKVSFKCELKGSGVAGTAPIIGRLFRIANMTETVVASTSVTYAVNSNFEGESATAYFWHGGTRHKATGCVANIKIPLVAGDRMVMEVELTGLYAGTPQSDVTFPTPTFSTVAPQIWDNANFVFTDNNAQATVDLVVSKLSIDLGNEIAKRPDANSENGIARYFVKQRSTKVEFDPEKVALSSFDPFTFHKNQYTCEIDTAPTGTAMALAVSNITLDSPKYGNRDDILTYELTGVARPELDEGNTEFSIVFTG